LTDSYGRHEFAYDETGQVTLARWQNMGKEHFGYDASGNMLFNREYDFAYGVGNRLLSYACDHVRLTYDDDGNVTSKTTPDGTTQYRWDSENRLIGITKADGTVIAYQYDELGRRIGKQIGWQQWRWSYLGEGQEVHRESGLSGQRFYTHGSGVDEHLSVTWSDYSGYHSNYYVANALGSIRQIVDAGGNALNRYRYTAFGKMKQVQEAIGNAYTYTGREWDADAGLYYYRARWYDADVGRFIQSDPSGIIPHGPRQGLNHLYVYARNNPLHYVDPSGLDVKDCYRPLNAPVLNLLAYHRYIWIDGAGWGLTTADGSSGVTTTAGRLEPDNATSGWGVHCVSVPVSDCQKRCLNQEISKGMSNPLDYNVYSYNCVRWVSDIFSRCGINR